MIQTLSESEPRFIRCVRPNVESKPFVFDSVSVLRQLKATGMVEAIKIRKMGYEFREHLELFIEKYWTLTQDFGSRGSSGENQVPID